jgi:hypothetical protein
MTLSSRMDYRTMRGDESHSRGQEGEKKRKTRSALENFFPLWRGHTVRVLPDVSVLVYRTAFGPISRLFWGGE